MKCKNAVNSILSTRQFIAVHIALRSTLIVESIERCSCPAAISSCYLIRSLAFLLLSYRQYICFVLNFFAFVVLFFVKYAVLLCAFIR